MQHSIGYGNMPSKITHITLQIDKWLKYKQEDVEVSNWFWAQEPNHYALSLKVLSSPLSPLRLPHRVVQAQGCSGAGLRVLGTHWIAVSACLALCGSLCAVKHHHFSPLKDTFKRAFKVVRLGNGIAACAALTDCALALLVQGLVSWKPVALFSVALHRFTL